MIQRDQFLNIIRSEKLSMQEYKDLEQLVSEYPWFALPRFLMLKYSSHQAEPDAGLLARTAVFSGDRQHLYKWIRGEAGSMVETSGLVRSELEFLDDEDAMVVDDETGREPFTLMEEHLDHQGEDADAQGIPEKEETEMEEPETDEPVALPVMDPLDDDQYQEDDIPVNEEQDLSRDKAEVDSADTEKIDKLTATEENLPEDPVPEVAERRNDHSADLIQQFLNSEPGVIKADKETSLEGDISEHSVKEDDSFITDTLAKIYVKQGLHAKAIYAYERLSLKYPEKSAYFAAQIEKIKNITNI